MTTVSSTNASWPADGGALGQLIRQHDWRATLGPVDQWSPVLRTCVDVVLRTPLAMSLLWGRDQIQLYNDSHVAILGPRHPRALGEPHRTTWPEVQDFLQPVHARVFAGESLRFSEQYIAIARDGAMRDAWFDLTYTPVLDNGQVVGILNTAVDVSARVLAGRATAVNEVRIGSFAAAGITPGTSADWRDLRQGALLLLGDRLRHSASMEQAAPVSGEILGRTLKATRSGFGRVDPVAATVEILPDWRATPHIASLAGVHHFADYGSFFKDLKNGEVVAIADVNSDPRTDGMREAFEAIGVRALLNVPVTNARGLVGVMLVHHDHPHDWTADEIAFGKGVADRMWSEMARSDAVEALGRLNANLERDVAAATADRNRLWQLSQDVMLVADFDGRIQAVNPAWNVMLGWQEADLVGSNLFDLLHPDDLADTIAAAASLDVTGYLVPNYTNRYRHRDGSYRWIAWNANKSDKLIVAVGRDISGDKARAATLHDTEEKLRHSQKMEAVGQLTGGLAHDFNNLLGSISGSLELLSLRSRSGDLRDLDRFIGIAQGAVRRAAALTHRLLAFSRRQPLHARPTDIRQLVAEMVDMVGRTIGPGIALQVDGDPQLWAVEVDHHQLENALLNLCLNARDAMPDGGMLRIGMRNGSVDAGEAARHDVPPGDYVLMSVTDTGAGMTPQVAAKAFDPFFTTKPIGQGTGLGLSMIYGFARQSGGYVRIDSAPGEGTTVHLALPRHLGAAAPAEAATAATAAPLAGAACILLVDDDEALRGLMAEALADVGHHVIEAADAAGAMRVLDGETGVDLMVTDIGLAGGINGRQLAEAAQRLRPRLPVLFITGYAEARLVQQGSLEEGIALLIKPFELDTLARRVAEMTPGRMR